MQTSGKPLTHQLDLNLLELFTTIYQTRNLTATGARLGLSQPAVSARLARLRLSYGDELFVRSRRGVVATALAHELAAPIASALQTVRSTVEREAFIPQRSQRLFRIAMSDIGERYFLPRLSQWLAGAAAQVSVQTLSPSADELQQGLDSGAIDLAVGFLPGLGKRMHRQLLFVERFVYLMRGDHPALREPFNLALLRRLHHVLASPPGTQHQAAVERVLLGPRVRATVSLRVQSFLSIGPIVAGSDLVSPVPSNLASLLSPALKLRTCAAPIALPAFEVCSYWHPRVNRDAASLWLRHAFEQLFKPPAASPRALKGAAAAAGASN